MLACVHAHALLTQGRSVSLSVLPLNVPRSMYHTVLRL